MATDVQKVLTLSGDCLPHIPEDYNGMGQVQEPNCSDLLTIYLTVNPRAMVVDSGYTLTETACATVRAAAAVAVSLAKDTPIMAAYTVTAGDIAKAFSDDGVLDKAHRHCAQMAELALKKAVLNYSQNR